MKKAFGYLIGAFIVYIVAYAALVTRSAPKVVPLGPSVQAVICTPEYRLGGEVAETFFVPLQWVDQRVNDWRWQCTPEEVKDATAAQHFVVPVKP